MLRRLKTDQIFAAAVFIIGLITYLSTVAPTTSFWDCGEFIACSYTMAVPHPPGSPLFLLLGRVMSILPTASDIGFRVNLLSVLFSSFSLMFLYLATVRLIRMYRGPDKSGEDSFIVGAGAFIGTLILGFSYSFWFNSVEAEVYSASTFFTAIALWLILKWQDYSDQPKGDKILLFIAYTIGLATGIHLLNLLALWALFMIIYFHKFKFTWAGFILQLIIASVTFFVIYPGVVKYIPSSMLSISVWAPVIIIIALIFALRWFHNNRNRIVAVSLAAILLVILGYSTYGVIYIRSSLNPVIDENDPDNLERLVYYMNREQYGKIDPLDRNPFKHNWAGNAWSGEIEKYKNKINTGNSGWIEWNYFWRYQVNYMYNRYFLWQFVGMKGDNQGAGVDFTKFLALPLLLGFIGMAVHFQRDGKRAFAILTLFVMTGYGVIVYLNQGPQPRERDYSYVGSFYAFAIWIGIGASYLLELVRNYLKKSPNLRKLGLYASSALIVAVVPGNMLVKNFNMSKRTGNYVAWDYSYNILQSCAPDAIIFTNGDNDTFPLWYLQEVEGVRKDIRVVNLSLLNTGWYIRQLRDQEPKVPISFKDDYIEKYIDAHDITALRRRYWPEGKREVSIKIPEGTFQWEMSATTHLIVTEDDPGHNNFVRVQDWMILNIIQTNQSRRPIYFAVTVSNTNMIGLRSYLVMEGLAFRLTQNEEKNIIDPECLRVNIFEEFEGHYRNLGNPETYFNSNIIKLLQNYRTAFLQLAFYHYQQREPGLDPYVSPLLRISDIVNPSAFMVKLADNDDPVTRYIRENLTTEALQKLQIEKDSDSPSNALLKTIVDELNRLLKGESLYNKRRFAGIELSSDIQESLDSSPRGERLIALNRALLEEAYPDEIAESLYMPLEGQYVIYDSLSSNAKVNLVLRWMEEKIPEETIPLHNEDINIQIGKIFFDIGYPEEFEKRLEKLVGQTDDWQKKMRYAAMYQQWLNDTDKASALLLETLEQVRGNDKASVEIAALLGNIGHTEQASGILDDILAVNPTDDIKLDVASAYYQLRMDSSAILLYQEMLARNSANGQAIGGLLSIYERMGDYQSALDLVDKWLKYSPYDTLAQKRRAFYQKMTSAG
ncbi:MAG: DUF2723 domain-containing protein [candidate division Zixibacteria bacterium]|nr:DUF2723 domain-containing protein [Candidatus Tariuqbacter arcticus]